MKNVLYIGFKEDGRAQALMGSERAVQTFRNRQKAWQWVQGLDYGSVHLRRIERLELGKMHEECEQYPEMAKCCDLCRPIAEKIAPYLHLLKPTPAPNPNVSTPPATKPLVKCPACGMRCPQGLSPKTWWPDHRITHEVSP